MRHRMAGIAGALLLLLLTSPVLAQTSWKWEAKTFTSEGQGYKFEWSYPQLVNAPGDRASWQKLLDAKVAGWANSFRNDFDDHQKELRQTREQYPNTPSMDWGSEGSFQVVWQDERRLVVLWQGYDFRGGAHGAHVLEVGVLDTQQPDSWLAPSSLFSEEGPVLETLSQISRAKLEEYFGQPLDEWALKGTEPRWENFSILYPTIADGRARYEITFPSYQVAPYAAGTPTIDFGFELLAPWAPTLVGTAE